MFIGAKKKKKKTVYCRKIKNSITIYSYNKNVLSKQNCIRKRNSVREDSK